MSEPSAHSDREKPSPSTAIPSSQSQSKTPPKSPRMVSKGSEPTSSASPSLRRSARLKSRGSATDGDDQSGSLCKNGDEGTGFDVDEGNASGSLSGSGKNKRKKVRVLGGSDSVEEMEVVEEPGGGDVEKELNLNVVEENDKGSSGSGSGKGRKRKTRASSGSGFKGESGSACVEDDVKKSDVGGVENEGVLKVDNDDDEGSECGDVRENNSVEMGNSRFTRSIKKKDSGSYSVKGKEGGKEIDGRESTDTMVEESRLSIGVDQMGLNSTLLHVEETMIEHGPKKTAKEKARENPRRMRREKKKIQEGKPMKQSPLAIVMEWMPSEKQRRWTTEDEDSSWVPSLLELSLNALAKFPPRITSINVDVPDLSREKLSDSLCNSSPKFMNFKDIELLFSGSPTEIRIDDCSWMTEDHLTTILQWCITKKLKVLHLHNCHCMSDDIIESTFGVPGNSKPELVEISLTGAHNLRDLGLTTLFDSANQLISVNLGQCSRISSFTIEAMLCFLPSSIRKLYLGDCPNIDVMCSLCLLKKLQNLEVLSVAGIPTVCDDFICGLVSVLGPNMKELVLSRCRNLTDTAVQAIAENCSRLIVLDIYQVHRLTDLAMGHLASGCRSIELLKISYNAFSDEAIAAFLEASAESLKTCLAPIRPYHFSDAVQELCKLWICFGAKI